MKEVVIQIPVLDAEQNVDIEVKINGKKRRLSYRVEIIACNEDEISGEERIGHLRQVIRDHDQEWDLVQIGAPIQNQIPITFRKRNVEA